MSAQMKEGAEVAMTAIEAAPVLAIALIASVGGMGFVAWLFMRSWRSAERDRTQSEQAAEKRRSEAEKLRMDQADERHKIYFAQLERMNATQVAAMDRGTEALKDSVAAHRDTAGVLGGVQELMRRLDRGAPA